MDNKQDNPNHFESVPNALTSSLAEWAQSAAVLDAYRKGINTIVREIDWMLPIGHDLNKFLVETPGLRYNSINERYAMIYTEWGFGYLTLVNFKLKANLSGPVDKVDQFIADIDKRFTRIQSQSTIEWYYMANGRTANISVALNYKKAYDSFYPYITSPDTKKRVTLQGYFTEYMKSDSTVLLLIGPPGTGKTSFIKNMLHDTQSSAMVTYDKAMLASDSLFVSFIADESTNFLVAEDADGFLGERRDGNDFMFKFLNVSDGLVSSANKKIVFSTNLPNVSSIDPALLRNGRCFDVVNFRPLFREEAVLAAKDIGKTLPDGDEFTLTELFNGKDAERQSRMGFI